MEEETVQRCTHDDYMVDPTETAQDYDQDTQLAAPSLPVEDDDHDDSDDLNTTPETDWPAIALIATPKRAKYGTLLLRPTPPCRRMSACV